MSDTLQQTEQPVPQTPTGEIKDARDTTTTTPEVPKTESKPSLVNEKDVQAPKGAPEKYEDFKVPEGYQLDPEIATEASTLFKNMGLDQSQAQSLVDFYVSRTNEALEAPYKLWQETQEKWISEIRQDPAIGHRLPEVRATVAKAIDSLGDQKLAADFRQAMDITGAGNNPAFVRAFYKLAQMVTEGKHVSGAGPSKEGMGSQARPETAAKALYPNLS